MFKKSQISSFILACLCTLTPVVHAQNLGAYGQVFPVIEEDIRQLIMKRLKTMEASGELRRHQRVIEERVARHIIRPRPLSLPTTKTPKTFHINPTVFVSQDIWTPDGTLIAKNGTPINPFTHIQFSKTLFFFNADDAHQMHWVKNHYSDYQQVKFILTGGDIREASELFGRIYFDLNGVISQKLHVRHVPSVVKQDGLSWKVTEIGADDE